MLAAPAGLAACRGVDGRAPRDLDELVVHDSLYFDPSASEPYTGPVFRRFVDDPTRNEIQGRLVDGTWHGELVIYYASGRIRYMGEFDRGDRCGPWTENRFDREPEDVLDQLRTEIETLGMYPPCPSEP
jgi:hypothetical protein